jgi:phosphate:Na+ symporter
LNAIASQPILVVVLAAVVTWGAHSSVAVVLVVISLASKGSVSLDTAYALVLGANLGTAINPMLEGATGTDPAAKRLPLGNLANRIIGVAVALAFLPYLGTALGRIEPNNARAVADFHTAFNVGLAAVLFPILPFYARILARWLPSRTADADPGLPLYLDPGSNKTPVIALGDAAREALRMADVVQSMLAGLKDALEKVDRRQITETRRMDDVLDKLNSAIKRYITGMDPEELVETDHDRFREILTFATNMEHAGDIIDKNLLGIANKLAKRGLTFSPSGQAELLAMIDRLSKNVRTAASLFMTGDQRAARLLASEKEIFRAMEAKATESHFQRMRAGEVNTLETSTMHLDALRDLKNVNASLVAAAAYPILERAGQLLPTRLRASA